MCLIRLCSHSRCDAYLGCLNKGCQNGTYQVSSVKMLLSVGDDSIPWLSVVANEPFDMPRMVICILSTADICRDNVSLVHCRKENTAFGHRCCLLAGTDAVCCCAQLHNMMAEKMNALQNKLSPAQSSVSELSQSHRNCRRVCLEQTFNDYIRVSTESFGITQRVKCWCCTGVVFHKHMHTFLTLFQLLRK